jgi:site-specific recombinase XerD
MNTSNHPQLYKTIKDIGEFRFIKDVESLISDSEQRMFLENVCDFNIIRNKAIVAMLYLTAGTPVEIVSLRIKDISLCKMNIKLKYILIDVPNICKGSSRKETYGNFKYEKFFIDCIYDYYSLVLKIVAYNINPLKLISNEYPITKDISELLNKPLFITAKGNKINKDTLQKAVRYYTHINAHAIRQIRLAHLLLHYDMPIKSLQKYAGLKNIRSIDPYVSLTVNHFEDKMNVCVS